MDTTWGSKERNYVFFLLMWVNLPLKFHLLAHWSYHRSIQNPSRVSPMKLLCPGVLVSPRSESQSSTRTTTVPGVFRLLWQPHTPPAPLKEAFLLLCHSGIIRDWSSSQPNWHSNVPRGHAKVCLPHLICFVYSEDLDCQGWGWGQGQRPSYSLSLILINSL